MSLPDPHSRMAQRLQALIVAAVALVTVCTAFAASAAGSLLP